MLGAPLSATHRLSEHLWAPLRGARGTSATHGRLEHEHQSRMYARTLGASVSAARLVGLKM